MATNTHSPNINANSSAPGTTSAAPRLHLAFLDGVRAVAALLVTFSHLWGVMLHHPVYSGLKGVLVNWLDNGHLWVNCFIILSGFCLMLPVARSRTLRGGWLAFYKSRARRILPPFYAIIAFSIVKTLLRDHTIPLPMVLVNIFLLQDIVHYSKALNAPLWSVALEWKIYFLFPVLVWLWVRYGYPVTLGVAAVISAVVLALYSGWPVITFMANACPWYVFMFAMGMTSAGLACQAKIPAHLPRVAWALLALSLVLSWAQAHFWSALPPGFLTELIHTPTEDILQGLTFSTLLFFLTRAAVYQMKSPMIMPLLSALSWRPLVWIGTFSYSLYLVHFLVIFAIQDHLTALLHTSAVFVIGPLDVALTVGIAYVFHLIFERPFMTKPGVRIKTEAQAEAVAIVNPAP